MVHVALATGALGVIGHRLLTSIRELIWVFATLAFIRVVMDGLERGGLRGALVQAMLMMIALLFARWAVDLIIPGFM